MILNKQLMFRIMMINMTINKHIIFFINILIGVLIVGFTFYRRFIVIRLPKSLFIFNDTVNYFLLLTVITGFSFCLYRLIITFYNLLNKKETKVSFFTKLNEIIENALFNLYSVVCNYIPDIYLKISSLAEKFYALFHKRGEYLLLFILYFIRIIILIVFLIDIFVFFKFDYFYKVLYFLCISLFIKLLLYILRDFASNLEDSESILIITPKGIDPETQLPITNFTLKEEYKKLDLDFYIKQYLLCSKLTGYFHNYDRYSKFFTPYLDVGISLLYLIGWSYILIVNIFN